MRLKNECKQRIYNIPTTFCVHARRIDEATDYNTFLNLYLNYPFTRIIFQKRFAYFYIGIIVRYKYII